MKVVNISAFSEDPVERILSNLTRTPFVFDGQPIASIEGFHQGIKYMQESRRKEIFGMYGPQAKRAGREANRCGTGYVWWGAPARPITWRSGEYYDLYFDALSAKFIQNDEARVALASTDDCRFSHVIRHGRSWSADEFEATHFCRALYRIRDFLTGRRFSVDMDDFGVTTGRLGDTSVSCDTNSVGNTNCN